MAAYFQALAAMETGTLSELAAPILKRHGASQGLNDEVCALLAGREAATPGGHTNLQILTEARQLATQEKGKDKE